MNFETFSHFNNNLSTIEAQRILLMKTQSIEKEFHVIESEIVNLVEDILLNEEIVNNIKIVNEEK